ncbi:hypothetical protein RFI_34306, partial [Reticulomyxa filosa]
IKSNRLNNKLIDDNIFNIFEMKMDYLSQIACEGLKLGQVVISCELQRRILNTISNNYPRKDISVISQLSRINTFGFLQGHESMNSSHPIVSVYFTHLTFQE